MSSALRAPHSPLPLRAKDPRREARNTNGAIGPNPHQGSAPLPAGRSPPPVGLTLATCYATAPVTAVSDLWVSGGDGRATGGNVEGEAFSRRGAGVGDGRIRVVVAGRSGSSRMSVWDLTHGRQLLEVCVCSSTFAWEVGAWEHY